MFATYPMEGKKHELWIFFSRISNSEIHVTQCVPCKVRYRVPMRSDLVFRCPVAKLSKFRLASG